MFLSHVENYRGHRIEIWQEEDHKHNLCRARVDDKTLSLANANEFVLLMQVKEFIDQREGD